MMVGARLQLVNLMTRAEMCLQWWLWKETCYGVQPWLH